MVEVTKSTFDSAGVSGSGGAPSAQSFDIHSWQGLTMLLKAARESGMAKEAYNDFRDIVLEYAQSGGDATLKKELDVRVGKLGIGAQQGGRMETSVPSEKPANPETHANEVAPSHKPSPQHPSEAFEQKRSLGGARPTPVFRPAVQRSSIPREMPSEASSEAKPEVRDTEAVRPEPTKRVHVIVDAKPMPEVESAPETTVPATQQQTAAAAPSPTLKSLDEYRARITQIKQTVNKKVGNPAALIDVSNNAGRRYMNALLTAMKLLGAAKTSELEAAMDVLEQAYAEVMSAGAPQESATETQIDQKPEKKESPADIPTEVADRERVESAAPEPRSETTIPLQEDVPLRSVKRPGAIPSLADLPVMHSPHVDESDAAPTVPELPVAHAPQEPAQQRENTHVEPAPVEEEEVEQRLATDRLAEKAENKYLMPNPKAAEMAPDPLQQSDISAPEVTSALQQLLSEWKLFGSSGIFGTGPSGHEHPLYQRISGLSMFEVLAGRFEKSTPEITQSIKDYVNSWRHEQGVSYVPSETFETYLRRVVRRILKRQGK